MSRCNVETVIAGLPSTMRIALATPASKPVFLGDYRAAKEYGIKQPFSQRFPIAVLLCLRFAENKPPGSPPNFFRAPSIIVP